ncbi:MAG: CRISPR-associated endonuclease Cas2 [Chitinophagales bacterium]|nr:CRISPR-associated endonuclease Cas2 [Chitinophagales bacterium]
MLKIITYDISENRKRTKIAKYLVRMGLTRVQYSIFVGDLPLFRWNQIILKLYSYLEEIDETDKLYVQEISKESFKNMVIFGESPNFEEILNEKKVWII